jgi:hypothetical protein
MSAGRRPTWGARKPFVFVATAVGLVALTIVIGLQLLRPTAAMDRVIASAIVEVLEGYTPSEGSLIVKVAPNNKLEAYHLLYQPPLAIWKYEAGRLSASTSDELRLARERQNTFIFVFSSQRVGMGELLAEVATYYPRSSTPGFQAGGNGSHWRFIWSNGQWTFDKEDTYIHWD